MCCMCNQSAIIHWSRKAGIFMDAAVCVLVIPGIQLFIYEWEEVQSMGEQGEALSELREFYYAVVCMHQRVTGFPVSG